MARKRQAEEEQRAPWWICHVPCTWSLGTRARKENALLRGLTNESALPITRNNGGALQIYMNDWRKKNQIRASGNERYEEGVFAFTGNG